MKTTAALLNELFETHRKPNGRAYKNAEVCEALSGAIQASHLGKLRSGTVKNPKRDTLLLLCSFFEVTPEYFFPELSGMVGGATDSVLAVIDTLNAPPNLKYPLEALLRSLFEEQEAP